MTVAELIKVLECYSEMAKRLGSAEAAEAAAKLSTVLVPASKLKVDALVKQLRATSNFRPKNN